MQVRARKNGFDGPITVVRKEKAPAAFNKAGT